MLVLVCLLVVLLWRLGQRPAPVLLGVYDDQQGWDIGTVRAMETWQNKRHAVVNMFTNWCDEPGVFEPLFARQLPNIWNDKHVPMITWEPFLCTRNATPAEIEVLIADGVYDDYIHRWARALRLFLSGPDQRLGTEDDRRVYLRLGHEMNIETYPWSTAWGNTEPEAFRRMWQHVWHILNAHGLEQRTVQWVWCVNFTDGGGARAEAFYPGDAYVDWLAVDGYNWGSSEPWSSWQSPHAVFAPMLARLEALSGKPIAITEVGTSAQTTEGIDPAAKAAWIADFFEQVPGWNVRMVAWFNADKAHEWAVFDGQIGDSVVDQGTRSYRTFASYRAAVQHDIFQSSNPANARLLTDAEFMGR